MLKARLLMVLLPAAVGSCATQAISEAGAIRRGCAALQARFHDHPLRCSDLSARKIDDQWLVTDNDKPNVIGGVSATISSGGRVLNVRVEQ